MKKTILLMLVTCSVVNANPLNGSYQKNPLNDSYQKKINKTEDNTQPDTTFIGNSVKEEVRHAIATHNPRAIKLDSPSSVQNNQNGKNIYVQQDIPNKTYYIDAGCQGTTLGVTQNGDGNVAASITNNGTVFVSSNCK